MPAAVKESKSNLLSQLEHEHNACRALASATGRTHYVFARGNPDGRIMFIGEAPGSQEDRSGKPFVGRAGKLLDKLIAGAGIDADDVYITNVVKARPLRDPQHPGKPRNDRPPNKKEIAVCLPVLQRQIALMQPSVICTLGATPLRALLDTAANVKESRGHHAQYAGINVVPTYHPAAVFHNPGLKEILLEDLKEVRRLMG